MSQAKSFNCRDCATSTVVVYKDRAEVKKEITTSIIQGENRITFTGLSEAVDGDSIRGSLEDTFCGPALSQDKGGKQHIGLHKVLHNSSFDTFMVDCVDEDYCNMHTLHVKASFIVEGHGSAVILDVIYSTNDVVEHTNETIEQSRTHGVLLQQIEEKEKDIKLLEFRQKATEKQKELLEIYSQHVIEIEQHQKGSQVGNEFSVHVNDTKVSNVLGYLKQCEVRLASLDERLKEIKTKKAKLSEEKQVLVNNANELDPKTKTGNSEVVRSVQVIMNAVCDCDVTLLLSYVVGSASWTPAYDIRVFSKDKLMKLHYYGMIKQSTGEDWNDAIIMLSTAQPDIGGSPPSLGIHNIEFVRPRALAVKSIPTIGFASNFRQSLEMYDPTIEDDSDEMEYRSLKSEKKKKSRRRSISPSSLEFDVTKVENGQLYNTTYKIPRKSTIPPDNAEHKVTVAIIDLSPEFSYISVPKKSPLSFLQALVKNNSSYAFLKGPANVFLDNNFLAKSELSDTSPSEEFTCSLGVDLSIRITPQPPVIVRGTTGRLTKSNLITYTYVYAVKNTQPNVVTLKVKDQVPLSSDERLKVVMMDPDIKKQGTSIAFTHGNVSLNDDNNIEWVCKIPPDEQISLKLMFALEFPPFDIVQGLQS